MTTRHDFIQPLRDLGAAEVVEGVRFLQDGNLVSAVGVTTAIEMSLWLVGQLYGEAVEQGSKCYIANNFPPRNPGDMAPLP